MDAATDADVVLRQHPLVTLLLPTVLPFVALLVVDSSRRHGAIDWLGVSIIVILTFGIVGLLVRERVEIDESTVHVQRLFTSATVARKGVVAVHRAGGRNRPAYLELAAGSAVRTRYRELREADTGRLPSRAVPLTALVSPSAVARALDVPYLTWSGREPVPSTPPQVTFRRITTQAGMLTWLLTICLVALVGMIVVGGLVSVLAT